MITDKIRTLLFVYLSIQVISDISIVNCDPEPKPKSGKKALGALAGGLAGAAIGSLLTRQHKSAEEHHHHYYANPPTVIDRRETLPNGCYKQVIKEPHTQDPSRFVETEQWVCPPNVQPNMVQSGSVVTQQYHPMTPVQPVVPVVVSGSPMTPSGYQQQQQQQTVNNVISPLPVAPVSNYPSQQPAPDNIATVPFPSPSLVPVVPVPSQQEPIGFVGPVAIPMPSLSPSAPAPVPSQQQPIGSVAYIPSPLVPNYTNGVVPISPASIVPLANQHHTVTTLPVHSFNQQHPPIGQQTPSGGTSQVYIISKKTGVYGKEKNNGSLSLRLSTSIVLMISLMWLCFI